MEGKRQSDELGRLPDDSEENREVAFGLLRESAQHDQLERANEIISNSPTFVEMISELRVLIEEAISSESESDLPKRHRLQ